MSRPEDGDASDPFVDIELSMPRPGETAVPPTLHVVPAATQSLVHPGEWVTLGVPGLYWLVDEYMVQYGPDLTDAGETYRLMPTSGFGAHRNVVPATDSTGPDFPFLHAVVSDMWLYRDGPDQMSVDEVPPWQSGAWFDQVQDSLASPPTVRHPRPAREMVSLSGRRVRVMFSGREWRWMIALSEPVMDKGEIVVPVCEPPNYHLTIYGHPPAGTKWVVKPPLHALWTY